MIGLRSWLSRLFHSRVGRLFYLATGKYFRPRVLFGFPLSLIYGRDVTWFRLFFFPFLRGPTLLYTAQKIEEHASTRTSTSMPTRCHGFLIL